MIEQIRVATGLFYPGEVLLLVFQWFLADAPRPTDKTLGHVQDPDPPHPSVAPQQKEAEARVSVQAGSLQRCGALSLRDFMRTLAG